MDADLLHCIRSCHDANNSGTVVGNDSYDLECIAQCTQQHTTLYQYTTEKYTHIFRIIAVVLITLGLSGKVFNCIIFLRKPLRGTSTGLLLLLKTIFDFVPLLWTFIFDTKFFVQDDQFNSSKLICALSRSTDIFVSWSIGFVILACTVRLATILHSNYLPQPTRLRVFILILLMMFCGLLYNWHVFYYQSLVEISLHEDNTNNNNQTITYCNILFGRQLGYFSFGGFQMTQELSYNAPIVNFIVSSLIPFTIVSLTNLVIILRVLKNPANKHFVKINNSHSHPISKVNSFQRPSLKYPATHLTKKDLSYETTITLTTSFVFLTTNSIASIYIYIKSSYRPDRSLLAEDVKTSNVFLILRMLSLIDTVLEFYIYFLTGKKFRQEVFHLIWEILQHTPLKNFFKFQCLVNNNNNNDMDNYEQERRRRNLNKKAHLQYINLIETTTRLSNGMNCIDSPYRKKTIHFQLCDTDETLERIESTV